MSLTDQTVKSLAVPGKYSDGNRTGLHLHVTDTGAKLWRFRYRHEGRENTLGLGSYPETKLPAARAKALEARVLVQAGRDPSAAKKKERAASSNTFAAVSEILMGKLAKVSAAATLVRDRHLLDAFLLPQLGSKPVAKITRSDVIACLTRIEKLGLTESVFRSKSLISRILQHAIATGLCEYDVSAVRGLFVRGKVTSHPGLTNPGEVGELMVALEGHAYRQHALRFLLQLLPHVFLRSSEIRGAKWSEISVERKEWRVPGERMKMGKEHVVPLSVQSLEILAELRALYPDELDVFPSYVPGRPLSENAVNQVLKRLGYAGKQCGHGFRTTASTLLNELGFSGDLIELQMAHLPADKVRAAYNKAQRLEERRAMLQRWSDYLDELKASAL